MKKRIAVLLALMIGFSYCPSGVVAMAAGNGGKIVESEDAAGNPVKTGKNTEAFAGDEKKEENPESSFLHNLLGNFFNEKEDKKEIPEDSSKTTQEAASKESASPGSSGLKNLQIPQKLDVVIDPWETDQKGQVYSEQYIISNTGETPGTLTLSNLACRPREQSGVIVRTDKEGLHDSGDKSIYMEMLLGNGERIIFSQESSGYQTVLNPGEELSICFTGEVNENAFGKWENNDISVSVVYSWETEEPDAAVEESEEMLQADAAEEITEGKGKSDTNEKESGKQTEVSPDSEELEELKNNFDSEGLEEKRESDSDSEKLKDKQQADSSAKEQEDRSGADTETGKSEEQQAEAGTNGLEKEPSDNTNADTIQETSSEGTDVETEDPDVMNTDGNNPSESDLAASGDGTAADSEPQNSESNSDSSEKEKEEIKNIVLQEPQKMDVVIDSWKVDEKGQIVSPQYLLQNTGNAVGIWTLSELVCKPQEQSSVAIITDKNGLHDNEEKSVYMELALGNGEKIVLSQDGSQYSVELKPGEKLFVRFVGEMKGDLFENRKDGDIAVTAVCTWNLG